MADEKSDGPAGAKATGATVSTTTIGPTITIRGKLQSHEDLVVKGRIDAEITSSKGLFIERSGVIRANMNVASAKISGILLGDVTADGKIEIASDGRMIGDMLAPRIVIQDGAAFRGKIDMPNFDSSQRGTIETPASSPQSSFGAAEPSVESAPAPPMPPEPTASPQSDAAEAGTADVGTAAAEPTADAPDAAPDASGSSEQPAASESAAAEPASAATEAPSADSPRQTGRRGLFRRDKKKRR